MSIEQLVSENSLLKNRMNDMQDKLNYFQQLQESLNNSILVAQEASERLKQNARKEAELILYEAEKDAERMYQDSVNRSKFLVEESEKLRRYSVEFRDRLINMVEAQLSLINREEYRDLFDTSGNVEAIDPESYMKETSAQSHHQEERPSFESMTFSSTHAHAEKNQDKASDSMIFTSSQEPIERENYTEESEQEAMSFKNVGHEEDDYYAELPDFSEEDLNFIEEPQPRLGSTVLGRTIEIDLPGD